LRLSGRYGRSWLAGLFLVLLLVSCQGLPEPFSSPTATTPLPTPTSPPAPTPLPVAGTIAGFDYLRQQLQTTAAAERQGLVNQYMAQLQQTPVVGGHRAVFLWQGAAATVALWGDMNDWNPDLHWQLSRLPDTDLWYYAAEFEPTARLDYQYIINNQAPRLDPLNPHTVPTRFEPRSELRMPAYRRPPELDLSAAVPGGTVTRHTLNSSALSQERSFWVYRPVGEIVGRDYPVLFVLDGGDYLNLISAPDILDNLIASRDILPLVVVFSTPVLREQEYRRSEAYTRFLADELVPYVQENFGVTTDPAQTGVMGSGLGGLAALHAAVTRPDRFGLAAGFSGFYSLDDEALARAAGRQTAALGRFYLVAGRYETAVNQSGAPINVPQASQRLAQVLQPRATAVQYDERPQGHSWGLWRDSFGDALRFLYPGSPAN